MRHLGKKERAKKNRKKILQLLEAAEKSLSYRDLCKATGIVSTSGIAHHINVLQKQGLLIKTGCGGIRLTGRDLPLQVQNEMLLDEIGKLRSKLLSVKKLCRGKF